MPWMVTATAAADGDLVGPIPDGDRVGHGSGGGDHVAGVRLDRAWASQSRSIDSHAAR